MTIIRLENIPAKQITSTLYQPALLKGTDDKGKIHLFLDIPLQVPFIIGNTASFFSSAGVRPWRETGSQGSTWILDNYKSLINSPPNSALSSINIGDYGNRMVYEFVNGFSYNRGASGFILINSKKFVPYSMSIRGVAFNGSDYREAFLIHPSTNSYIGLGSAASSIFTNVEYTSFYPHWDDENLVWGAYSRGWGSSSGSHTGYHRFGVLYRVPAPEIHKYYLY